MSQFKRTTHKKINQSSTNSKQSLFILSDDEHDNSSLELTATTTIKQPKSSKLSKEPKEPKTTKQSKEFKQPKNKLLPNTTNLIFDVREHDLIEQCQTIINNDDTFSKINVLIEQLPLGDIIINNGFTDVLLIERKSINDLASSITDGRYEEQSFRLNGIEQNNHNIMYLIEGNLSDLNKRVKISKQAIYSALLTLGLYKGFSIMRTMNLIETAEFVCNSAKKIMNNTKDKKYPFYYAIAKDMKDECLENNEIVNGVCKNNIIPDNYNSVVKRVKKENITPENIGELMLASIPSVGSSASKAIMTKYKDIESLVIALKNDNNVLNEITTTDSNNKQRKLSKNIIKNIIHYLGIA
jgi:ERCC4-type nuclease